MHRLLQCDPTAYRVSLRVMLFFRIWFHGLPWEKKANQDTFLQVLMESMIPFKVTLEAEYASLLFSIDGLRHVMLRDLPIERSEASGDFHISKAHFLELRIDIVAGLHHLYDF